jgi:hypothetical protein
MREKSFQEIAEELLVENSKLRILLMRCQDHLEDGFEADVIFQEINRAISRTGEFSVSK